VPRVRPAEQAPPWWRQVASSSGQPTVDWRSVAVARSPSSLYSQLGLHRFASLRAFQHRNFRVFWLGAFVSNVGTWMETIAIGVWVTQTTGRAGWTATVAALTYMPALVLGPLGGAIADRRDRRQLVAWLTWAQLLLAATLAALALLGRLSLPVVSVLAFLTGCANTLLAPVSSALLSELVPRKDLLSAVSLSSAQYNLGRIVGPMLAAVVMAAGGLGAAFALNALSFVAVMVAVGTVQLPAPEPRLHGNLLAEIRTGVRVAHEDAGIRTALWLTFAVGALVAPFIGLLPVFAIQELRRGASGTSLLATAQGVGAVGAAFLAGSLAERWGRERLLTRASAALALLATLYWLSPNFGLAVLGICLVGGAYLTTLSTLSSVCLSRVSRLLQARVASLYGLVLSTSYGLGLLGLGWSGDHFGLRRVMVVAALSCLAVVLVLKRGGRFSGVDGPARFLGTPTPLMTLAHVPGPDPVEEVRLKP
jgi:MFS family permease